MVEVAWVHILKETTSGMIMDVVMGRSFSVRGEVDERKLELVPPVHPQLHQHEIRKIYRSVYLCLQLDFHRHLLCFRVENDYNNYYNYYNNKDRSLSTSFLNGCLSCK